jgi:hypothetical protein
MYEDKEEPGQILLPFLTVNWESFPNRYSEYKNDAKIFFTRNDGAAMGFLTSPGIRISSENTFHHWIPPNNPKLSIGTFLPVGSINELKECGFLDPAFEPEKGKYFVASHSSEQGVFLEELGRKKVENIISVEQTTIWIKVGGNIEEWRK